MNIYHAQGLVEEMRFLTIGLWCMSIKAMWSSHQRNTGIPVSSEQMACHFFVLNNIPWRSLKWMSIILSPRTFCWTSGPHLKFGSVSIVFSTAMGLQVFTSPSGRQRILRQRSLLLEWGGSPRSWSGKKTFVGRWTLHEKWHSRHPHQVLMPIPSSGAMVIRVLIYPKRIWGLKSKHLIYWIHFVIGSQKHMGFTRTGYIKGSESLKQINK